MELVAGSRELDKTRFLVLLEQEFGWLKYIGQIRLGGSLANSCITTNCLVDRLPIGGRRRGFTPRTSVSSLITHRYVVFVFASSSTTLLPFILLLCYYEYGLEQLFCTYVGPMWHSKCVLRQFSSCSCIFHKCCALLHVSCLTECPSDILKLNWTPMSPFA